MDNFIEVIFPLKDFTSLGPDVNKIWIKLLVERFQRLKQRCKEIHYSVHWSERYKEGKHNIESSANIQWSILSMKLASSRKGSASSEQASYLNPRKPAKKLNNYNNHR